MTNATLYRIQKRSAIVFALFLFVHLGNAVALLAGAEAFDRVQRLAHPLYGNYFVESILLLSLVAHTAAALVLWYRRPVSAKRSVAMQLQTWAGVLMLVLVPGHVFFTRIAAQMFEYAADFQFLSFSADIWPTFFAPYYMFFGAAGAFHLLHGLQRFFKPRALGWPHWVAYGSVTALMFAVGIAVVATKPLREPTDEEIVKYLRAVEMATPWMIEMADQDPYILRYQELKR